MKNAILVISVRPGEVQWVEALDAACNLYSLVHYGKKQIRRGKAIPLNAANNPVRGSGCMLEDVSRLSSITDPREWRRAYVKRVKALDELNSELAKELLEIVMRIEPPKNK